MIIGEQVRLHLLEQSEKKKVVRVIEVESGAEGTLKIKGDLRVRKDGTVSAWVIQHDSKNNRTTYGNAFFGKYTISKAIGSRYVSIIKKLYDNPKEVGPDEVGCLKGMCNRCIKKDQWDWYTTWQYIGYPSRSVLTSFVSDSVIVRDALRQGVSDGIVQFRAKYNSILCGMLFHLSEEINISDDDLDVPVPEFAPGLWKLLAVESKRNIKIAERLHSKASQYVLMHYFATLEQEFADHFVRPFLRRSKIDSKCHECTNDRYKRTHDVLIGKAPVTLGGVEFLGSLIESRKACEASDAIRVFRDFLGSGAESFSEICVLISREKISGYSLPKLRNGLAHGDATIVECIDGAAFDAVRSILFALPVEIIPRILKCSMKA